MPYIHMPEGRGFTARLVKPGEKSSYLRFKSKHNHRQSYKSKCIGTNIKVLDNAVQLPKSGRVKCRISKKVKGRILSATVSRNPSGKYFVALCCTDIEREPLPFTGATVGLDIGIKAFAVSSDDVEYPNHNHKYLAKSEKKLARLQRKLSQKQRGVICVKMRGFEWRECMNILRTSERICYIDCPRN